MLQSFRKVIAIFLAGCVAVGLSACGLSAGKSVQEADETAGVVMETEKKEEMETEIEAKMEDADVIDGLSFRDAVSKKLTVTVDGKTVEVMEYEDLYIPNPSIDDQKVSIYVPEGATADSPIVLCVNNSGWMANSYASRTKIADDGPAKQKGYSSSDDRDKVGAILSRNFVMVSYGCRSRNNEAVNGVYNGHSPATAADTKAVIRYLRYNAADIPAGDPEKIIVTGTSGGGALSTLIAASGNSSDYYEALYDIGAAGIERDGDSYVSTIRDDVFAVIAYCPITDLPNADAAYEWTYADTRAALKDVNVKEGTGKSARVLYSEADKTFDAEISTFLAGKYSEYVDSLDLKLDDGTTLNSGSLKGAVIHLMEVEIEESMEKYGEEQMKSDIARYQAGPQDWLVFHSDGTFSYDYDTHLRWIAANNQLKVVNAFSNSGLPWASKNEDSLFGAADAAYCAFEEYSWDHDSVEGNGCGLDDTGLTWEEFLKTEAGQTLILQMRMTNTIAYLNDSEGTDAGTKAACWYVRYGMLDRDSSFALETVLRYSISNCRDIDNMNFQFAWLIPHIGDYDVTEAYQWLDSIL